MTRAADLIPAIIVASELEALAEVRDRLLDLLQVPDQLFRVHIEGVAGSATQCRASLELTDRGRDLAAALRAGNVDSLVVEKVLAHFNLSCGLQPGVDAESPGRETDPATERPASAEDIQ